MLSFAFLFITFYHQLAFSFVENNQQKQFKKNVLINKGKPQTLSINSSDLF